MLVSDRIRLVIDNHVDIEVLDPAASLWSLGMDSLSVVAIMVGVEDEFSISIPTEMITRENFHSVDSLVSMVEKIIQPA